MARLFGTDGVRGVANRELTPELAFAIGRAAITALGGQGRPRLVIGRDTRISGLMLESAIAAGACSAGGDVLRVGMVPTPAVAFMTSDLGARVGAVVSASHNPSQDNGIKLFSGDGFKLPDEVEDEIERLVREGDGPRPEGGSVGRIIDAVEEPDRYLDHLEAAAEASLGGMRIVVDGANGAAFRLGPDALRRLGAEVEAINVDPDGTNINDGCGATHPDVLAAAVVERGADAGVAFDGDADRAMFADAEGAVIDGDQVIVACALAMQEGGQLAKDAVVVTVMANLGLRRALQSAGISVLETQVGDRYVLEEMRRVGAALGGEQSGHVIFLDDATTGDGLLTAVRFLTLAARRGVSVAGLASAMRRFPQVLESVRVDDPAAVMASPALGDAIGAAESALGGRGRVLVRPSGTEPVIRVMVEAETEDEARAHAGAIAATVSQT
ncbi:MAG TPA: phosphoglucosamine mutase [Actinomycetota bacterium]|jgi:phosphoglucosamine mutase|nr:phosphoglucosamine mutase [Actinomycetota bacterium]